MEDEQSGDMEVSEPLTTDVEGKPSSLGRRQSLDNNSDEDTLTKETIMPAPLSNSFRSKKLKTERDEPTTRIRNRSKTSINTRTSEHCDNMPILPLPLSHINAIHLQDTDDQH